MEAGRLLDRHPSQLQLAVLLAVEAMYRNPSLEADHVLRRGLTLLHPVKSMQFEYPVQTVVFSPNGQYLVTLNINFNVNASVFV